jgi:hypothetical protein
MCVLIDQVFLAFDATQRVEGDVMRVGDGFDERRVAVFTPTESRGGIPVHIRLRRPEEPFNAGKQGFNSMVQVI